MSKLWDLVEYVEANPGNQAQRWRLAKKLYAAWEYRLALEHLQILEKDGGEEATPNIYRYLAATYFRLKRYEEALRALTSGLERWPEDVGLWEQRARTLKADGKFGEAAAAWSRVADIDPANKQARTAAKALKKLAEAEEDGDSSAPTAKELGDAMMRIVDFADIQCNQCGADNSQESKACWQCGKAIEKPRETTPPFEVLRKQLDAIPWIWITAILIPVLAGIAIYVSWPSPAPDALPQVPESIHAIWHSTGMAARLTIGGILLLAWPCILYFAALALTGNREPDRIICLLSGILMALGVYVAFYLAPPMYWLVPMGIVLPGGLIASLAVMDFRGRYSLLHYLIQLGVISILMVAGVYGVWGASALTMPAGLLNTTKFDRAATVYENEMKLPVDLAFTLTSTGSGWLDSRTGMAGFTVNVDGEVQRLVLEIRDPSNKAIAYEATDEESGYTESRSLQTGVTYRILVAAPGSEQAQLRLWSPLPITVQE